jgi:SAM-dependent methyltransferase
MPHQSQDQPFYAGAAELFAQEKHLTNYCVEVARSISAHTKGAARVLEFGAGIGTLALNHRRLTGVQPICLEVDPTLAQVLKERGFACLPPEAIAGSSFDAVYSSNVLEHIQDDVSALRSIKASLQPEGRLVLYLPARKEIYNELDRLVGHYRRYDVDELKAKLSVAGFDLMHWEYADSVGYLAWGLSRFRRVDPSQKLGSALALSLYDRLIHPISSALDRIGMRRVIGKNILAVAKPRP